MGTTLRPLCSIAKCLEVLGERWTFLILRDAFLGVTRFSEFRANLNVAPDVLSDRLATLVEAGVLAQERYQDPGTRARLAYRLTPSGKELFIALSALQQWGDDHLASAEGPSVLRKVKSSGRTARVGFIDDHGLPIDARDVAWRWSKPEYDSKNHG